MVFGNEKGGEFKCVLYECSGCWDIKRQKRGWEWLKGCDNVWLMPVDWM